jgi:cbb3-type cytochrome oxidase subunit 3
MDLKMYLNMYANEIALLVTALVFFTAIWFAGNAKRKDEINKKPTREKSL